MRIFAGTLAVAATALVAFVLSGCNLGSEQSAAASGKLVTTQSGLRYKDVRLGEGREARKGDCVSVHYEGKLLKSGKLIDSTYRRRKPFAFKLGSGEVIKGWEEGIVGMRVGGKRRLIIPPELAYGKNGAAGGIIPAEATLVYEIELLGIPELGIEDVEKGSGKTAEAGDILVVHFTGKLESGEVFDSTYERGRPLSFELGARKVIQGWEVGLAGMRIGGKRKLVVPPELGFGSRDNVKIPGNSTLYYEIELLDIE